jgi:ABC-type Fe3+-hydroxamate transport system substrate-binding protein
MRIVSLFPSATETLFELGLWDQVVGITTFCTMPAKEVRDKSKVGGTKNPDIDKIEQLQPDIVIVNSEENRKEHADELRRRGIRLFVTHPRTVEDAVNMIAAFGHEFGAESGSRQIRSEIFQRLGAIEPPRRYRSLVLVWNDPYMTASRGTYVDSICRLFGFDNIIHNDSAPYPSVTDAELASTNPEVLLLPDEPYAFREKHAQEIREKFPGIGAVRENRLLLFNGMYLTWHGFGTLRALREFPAVLKASRLW